MATDGTGALSVASTAAPVSRPVAVDIAVGADDRRCARPDCTDPARATLSFSYHDQHAVLTRLTADRRPQAYDLCPQHAARTTAPHGWHLRDDRPEDERTEVDEPAVPDDLGSDRTVAVLAAALRAVPSTSSRNAERQATPSSLAPTDPPPVTEAAATEPDPTTIDALIDLDDSVEQVEPAGGTEGTEPADPAELGKRSEAGERSEPAEQTERADLDASVERFDPAGPAASTTRSVTSGPASRSGGRRSRPVLAARGPDAVPGDPTGPAADW